MNNVKNKLVNIFCVLVGACLIVAGFHNFLSASPSTSGRYQELLASVGLIEAHKTAAPEKPNTIPTGTGEEGVGNNKDNVLNTEIVFKEEVNISENHTHTWTVTQEYDWIDLGNGRGRMEIIDIEKCECGEKR